MREIEREIVNGLQGGFPLAPRPFAEAAAALGTDEATLIAALEHMLDEGTLTRFGPMYDVEKMGGAFTLCAMRVPQAEVERVAAHVNTHPEVAHNYERAHEFNLWFVVAAGAREAIAPLLAAIEAETGYPVLDLPREREYFIELRLAA
ncbi:MAG: Lrp/AsnC family transcriptional regulator [Burkholderiales bacterium]